MGTCFPDEQDEQELFLLAELARIESSSTNGIDQYEEDAVVIQNNRFCPQNQQNWTVVQENGIANHQSYNTKNDNKTCLSAPESASACYNTTPSIRTGVPTFTKLTDGDTHVCFGVMCRHLTTDKDRQLVCGLTGEVIATETTRDTDSSWTGRSTASSNVDDIAGIPVGGWTKRRDMFQASSQAYAIARTFNESFTLQDVSFSTYSMNIKKEVKIKKGARCVDDNSEKPKVPAMQKHCFRNKNSSKLEAEALTVLDKLFIVHDEHKANDGNGNGNGNGNDMPYMSEQHDDRNASQNADRGNVDDRERGASDGGGNKRHHSPAPAQAPLSAPAPAPPPAPPPLHLHRFRQQATTPQPQPQPRPRSQLNDPRLENSEFVRVLFLKKYVKTSAENAQKMNLDVLNNVCIASNTFCRKKRQEGKRAAEEILKKQKLLRLSDTFEEENCCFDAGTVATFASCRTTTDGDRAYNHHNIVDHEDDRRANDGDDRDHNINDIGLCCDKKRRRFVTGSIGVKAAECVDHSSTATAFATTAKKNSCHTSVVFSGQVRSLLCKLIVNLWFTVLETPFAKTTRRSLDSFKPFTSGVLYSLKRGIRLSNGICVVPELQVLSKHLPALRSSKSTMAARNLQSSSHRGLCFLHKSLSSIKTVDFDTDQKNDFERRLNDCSVISKMLVDMVQQVQY